MRINDLYGQSIVKRQLLQTIVRNQVAHAYLFGGPPGSGKRTAAMAFAQALNCLQPSDGDACDQCPACRKIRLGSHADVIWVEPEGESFRLEQVREIQKRASRRPYEGRWQIVTLSQADHLTAEAGNALLKLLEEPSPANIFILISDRTSEMLPTVQSRCQMVHFRPLDAGTVASFLKDRGAGDSTADWLASQAQGSLGKALELMEASEGAEKERDSLLNIWSKIWTAERLELLSLAKQLADRDGNAVMTHFTEWIRDAWIWRETGDKSLMRNSGLVELLPPCLPPGYDLAKLNHALLLAWDGLNRNLQKQLMWEVLLLNWPQPVAGEGGQGWYA